MKTLIMYQLEGVKDENVVKKVLAKHFPNGAEKFGVNVFVPLASAPDFCKLIGYVSQQNSSKLEEIAGVITQEGYDRKLDKFNQKYDKMQQKLMSARKTSNASVGTGFSGLTAIANLSDIVNQAQQFEEQQNMDAKVAKAKSKLDSYVERNKTLHESTKYTAAGKSVGGLVSWGAGTESNEKNIFDELAAEKKTSATFIDTSMEKFKKLLEDLLKLAPRVGVMAIVDGNRTSTINTTHIVKLESLTATKLANAQNREMFFITK